MGLGFVSYADEELCFYLERLAAFIQRLDFEQGTDFTMPSFPRVLATQGGRTFRRRVATTTRISMGPDTTLAMKGKFQCYPWLWQRHSVPIFTMLLHAPAEVALARAISRVPVSHILEEEHLFHSWYEPSYFRYAEEVGLLEQADAIIDTHRNRAYLL